MSLFNQVALRCLKLSQRNGYFSVKGARNWGLGIPRSSIKSSAVALQSSRTSSPGEVHPGYIKIREKMEKFQVDDGVPIHLKCGTRDVLLFGFTLALGFYGLGMTFWFYYNLIYPKKPDAGNSNNC